MRILVWWDSHPAFLSGPQHGYRDWDSRCPWYWTMRATIFYRLSLWVDHQNPQRENCSENLASRQVYQLKGKSMKTNAFWERGEYGLFDRETPEASRFVEKACEVPLLLCWLMMFSHSLFLRCQREKWSLYNPMDREEKRMHTRKRVRKQPFGERNPSRINCAYETRKSMPESSKTHPSLPESHTWVSCTRRPRGWRTLQWDRPSHAELTWFRDVQKK